MSERLTVWADDHAIPRPDIRSNGHQRCANKLAHYEDLEEAGRLIELPCAVGDTVYTIPRSKPRKWKVVYIGICGDGSHYMNIAWYKDHHNFETRSVYFKEIGKTVFLTQEEAEAELERRMNDR